MAQGRFIDFPLIYADGREGGLDNDQQAQTIIAAARKLLDEGAPGVAITYSANEGQTRALAKAYAAGAYAAQIAGANQADVMRRMETRLGDDDNADLRLRLRIAPITTIPAPGTDPAAIVQDDLARLRGQLDAGWAILGWRNQNTLDDAAHPYAIGGGVAGRLPPAVDAAIQDGLKALAAAYPAA